LVASEARLDKDTQAHNYQHKHPSWQMLAVFAAFIEAWLTTTLQATSEPTPSMLLKQKATRIDNDLMVPRGDESARDIARGTHGSYAS